MILIGQYDSSFVRRVGIALTLYRLPFEHRPWSVFSDAERIRPINPLVRVPVLILGSSDSDEALIGTDAILDHLDSLAPSGQRLSPTGEPERRRAMKVSAVASGLADTAVSLFYEKVLHPEPSRDFVGRRTAQLLGAVAALEADRAGRQGPYWFGDGMLHADIAVAAALRHAAESHPDVLDLSAYPALVRHCGKLEALPVFQEISQPFVPPA
jgi:glutathione S-transferase